MGLIKYEVTFDLVADEDDICKLIGTTELSDSDKREILKELFKHFKEPLNKRSYVQVEDFTVRVSLVDVCNTKEFNQPEYDEFLAKSRELFLPKYKCYEHDTFIDYSHKNGRSYLIDVDSIRDTIDDTLTTNNLFEIFPTIIRCLRDPEYTDTIDLSKPELFKDHELLVENLIKEWGNPWLV
jgi:hypothetical protein